MIWSLVPTTKSLYCSPIGASCLVVLSGENLYSSGRVGGVQPAHQALGWVQGLETSEAGRSRPFGGSFSVVEGQERGEASVSGRCEGSDRGPHL